MKTTKKLILSSLIAVSTSATFASNVLSPPLQDNQVQVTFINDTKSLARSTNMLQYKGSDLVPVNVPDLKPGEKTTITISIPPGGTTVKPFPTFDGISLIADWSRDYPQHGSAGAMEVLSYGNVLSVKDLSANYKADPVKYNHPIESITIHIKTLP